MTSALSSSSIGTRANTTSKPNMGKMPFAYNAWKVQQFGCVHRMYANNSPLNWVIKYTICDLRLIESTMQSQWFIEENVHITHKMIDVSGDKMVINQISASKWRNIIWRKMCVCEASSVYEVAYGNYGRASPNAPHLYGWSAVGLLRKASLTRYTHTTGWHNAQHTALNPSMREASHARATECHANHQRPFCTLCHFLFTHTSPHTQLKCFLVVWRPPTHEIVCFLIYVNGIHPLGNS